MTFIRPAPTGVGELAEAARRTRQIRVNQQTGTTYTFVVADNDRIVEFTSATAVTATVPSDLPAGWNCVVVQIGAGKVTFAAGGGSTVNSANSKLGISARYGTATIYSRGSGLYLLSGSLN